MLMCQISHGHSSSPNTCERIVMLLFFFCASLELGIVDTQRWAPNGSLNLQPIFFFGCRFSLLVATRNECVREGYQDVAIARFWTFIYHSCCRLRYCKLHILYVRVKMNDLMYNMIILGINQYLCLPKNLRSVAIS